MSKYIVSGYVITVCYDTNEIEAYLQNEERDDWTDYDFVLKTRGKKAVDMENNINIGDTICIDFPGIKEDVEI